MNLRRELYAWRDNEAAKRGVELFRILPNNALDEIVKRLPRTKDELVDIKGIKEAKYREYGQTILEFIDRHSGSARVSFSANEEAAHAQTPDAPLSIGAYLDMVNHALGRMHARVEGEIITAKSQGKAAYLTLKDEKDESVLNVFMWLSDLGLSGVSPEPGMRVIVSGSAEIYKPSGRFSFRAETIELVGEGALKKAYDALRKKLDSEGLFAPERKRPIPQFPEKIGVITSKQGAVIHDFMANLGKYGFRVSFVDSRVEGAVAVKDIVSAIARMKTLPIDTLVIIRGGGSLESLQAFNNEAVVRAIAEFPRPVICAIGHDKDVPLAQLVADIAPSTPTAATAILNRPWIEAVHAVRNARDLIFTRYERSLSRHEITLRTFGADLSARFDALFRIFDIAGRRIELATVRMGETMLRMRRMLDEYAEGYRTTFLSALRDVRRTIEEIDRELTLNDPVRQLGRGFSILSARGKVIRSVTELSKGDDFEARLSGGTIEAKVALIRKE